MRLEDCIVTTIDNRGKNPKAYFTQEQYPVIDNVLIKNTLYPDMSAVTRYIDDETFQNFLRGYVHKDMPIMTLVGNGIGNVTLAPSDKCAIIQNTIGFLVNDKIDQVYLYYYLLTQQDRIKNFNRGSGQPSVRKTDILSMEIDIPEVETQQRIVSILKSIDEKIENNNKINDNLQQQAMALYASMFLDNPALETTAGTLKDIADITMGQSPSGSSYNEDGNGEAFYQGRAEFGYRFPTRRLYTTEPKRMAEAGDVLLSVRAPVGDLNVAYERCCIGRGLGAIHGRNGYQSFVLYTMFVLRPQLDIYNGEGTVFGSINRNALNDMPIDIPSEEAIAAFEAVVRPMDDMIRSNYEENCRLQELRDSLLPRLMSGEIDVSDIDI